MKTLIISLILLIWNTSNYKEEKYLIKILPGSQLRIEGQTNVNCFSFDYDPNLLNNEICIATKEYKEKMQFDEACLNLSIKGFDSGNRIMNEDLYKLLNASDNPFISISIISVNPDMEMENDSIEVNTKIKLNGIENRHSLKIHPNQSDENLFFKGSTRIKLDHYKIQAPSKFFGMVKVKNDLEIQLNLKLKVQKV